MDVSNDADLEWMICLCSNALNAAVETRGESALSASLSCAAPDIPRTFRDHISSRTHSVNIRLSYLIKV